MKRKNTLLFAVLGVAFSLHSCSGTGTPSPPPVGGNATVSVVLTATPLVPPPTISLLSFSAVVTGISLSPVTGTLVNIPLNATNLIVDLTKLQSDSVFLGASTTIPAGTYSAIAVSFSNPVLWFCAANPPGTPGCSPGGVTKVTGGGTAAPITTTLTLTGNQKTGVAVSLNLANAITVSTQGVPTFNLAASKVLSAATLPGASTSLTTGQLDFVEDVTGVVSAINATAQSVTVQTATYGLLTAKAGTATVFSPNCTNFNLSLSFSCVTQGHVASLDTTLLSDGTFALTEYDPLATSTGDWIEGVVTTTPTSPTQFQLMANDLVIASTGSLIGTSVGTLVGAAVNVTLVNPKVFTVDTKGLTVPATSFGGTDASILRPGQTVAVHLTRFTLATGTTLAAANADTVILRFTRLAGSISVVSAPTFSIQSLPPLFGVTVPLEVQLSTGSPSTNYDGVANATSLSSGQTASMRALYFGTTTATPFSAAKLRVP
jgi:hypothetical protein